MPAEEEKRGRLPGARKSRKILLVEDDPVVAAGLALQLESYDHVVAVVGTGSAANPAIEKAGPDIVILDIGLPDMSGATVYRMLRDRWPALPVIFSTGHAARRGRHSGRRMHGISDQAIRNHCVDRVDRPAGGSRGQLATKYSPSSYTSP